ncbi:DnaJ-domain-containing protein [Fragilariopsis cylindrus CCMP1102]|uniref:DnaJ-domain-containing protein n=1 Tax=Fragilariopsis cylindrus CCMP1102 TaxID=635003 RepID=A0A1E7FFB5_9STRA|nr:DnaJ-domain-containing protein [Fragilariopsis cylindrus CCMP1102]|eukprot:OEU16483.1 DnaJ-domain-containing protein [Fragilariopsis cylindrus CCMP1102]
MNGIITNHYDVLNVSKNATYEEIKESFHRLARAKHPDRQHRMLAVAEFRKIQQAWQVLRDSDQRILYDSDLLQKELQIENKRNGAIELDYDDDLEEAFDEETNEKFMVYDCRCGEEIHIDYNNNNNNNNNIPGEEEEKTDRRNDNDEEIIMEDDDINVNNNNLSRSDDDDDDDYDYGHEQSVSNKKSNKDVKDLLVDCPGCCFVYRINHRQVD